MDDLQAILIRQYNPYEAGTGKIFRVMRSPRPGDCGDHLLLFDLGKPQPASRSGTPAKIAREIRETVAATPAAEYPATTGWPATCGRFSATHR